MKNVCIVHDENHLRRKILGKAKQQAKDSLQKFEYCTYLWIKEDSSSFEPNENHRGVGGCCVILQLRMTFLLVFEKKRTGIVWKTFASSVLSEWILLEQTTEHHCTF